jgi:hypothetical protein
MHLRAIYWFLSPLISRDRTNESSDMFNGIIWSRQDTNYDENVVFDEIPDHNFASVYTASENKQIIVYCVMCPSSYFVFPPFFSKLYLTQGFSTDLLNNFVIHFKGLGRILIKSDHG